MNKTDFLSILGDVGLSQEALSLYDRFDADALPFGIETDEKIQNFTLDKKKKGDILVAAVQTGMLSNVEYAIYAHAFLARGYNPVVLSCYKDLEICHRKERLDASDGECELCYYGGQKLFGSFNFEFVDLEDYIREEAPSPEKFSPSDEITFGDIDLKPFCKSSTRKNLRVHDLDFTQEHARTIFQNYAAGAVTLARATEELIMDYDFKAALGGPSVYIYGIPLEVARKEGINTYVPSTGRLPKTKFVHRYRGFGDRYDDPEYVLEHAPDTLSEERIEVIDYLMEARKEGQHQDIDTVSGEIELSEGTSVCVFTNMIWDSSLEGEGEGIADVLEWLELTIEILMAKGDLDLIIKTHPKELRGTNEPVEEWIRNRFEIEDNTRILRPDTEIDTYDILEKVDIACVYNSTVGLEAAYENVPVIVGGDTHYRELGFTNDADSPSHYRELLSDLSDLKPPYDSRKRLYSYLHYYFLQRHLHFPYFVLKNEDGRMESFPVKHEELAPGNEVYDHIVERILANDPVHYPRDGPYLDDFLTEFFSKEK